VATMADSREMAPQGMIDEIVRLAATKQHKLSRFMVDGRPLTLASAVQVLAHLNRPGLPDVPAGAPAEPARPAAEAEPVSPRWGKGAPIGEDGIFYYNKRVYKVYTSQYDGVRRAKVLTIEPEHGKRGEWVSASRALAGLREPHRMTAEQSREYEAMYGVTVCKHCGAPLENDESRARRVGPVCLINKGP
jgi:hypothetical protein